MMKEAVNPNPLETKKHLTKKEREQREEGIIRPKSFTIPANPPAYFDKEQKKKWREMRKMYLEAECAQLFCFTDANALEMYCVTYCEAQTLIKEREDCQRGVWAEKWNLAFNRTMGLLIKMQREMFLTPLSRVRAGSMQKFYDDDDKPKNPVDEFDL